MTDHGEDASEKQDAEQALPTQPKAVHSIFPKSQRYLVVVMVTFAAFVSPLSASIYFPVLNTLSRELSVSSTLINLTITSYMVLQGVAPMFFGVFTDQLGRRPAYIIAFFIYFWANIGLALQRSYVALILLRCLQSTGSSGTIAIGMGVVADVATAAERGTYMGAVISGTMLGPAIGPVIGGLLAQFLGWPSVFWFLAIASGTFLLLYWAFVPETSRKIVGNGSIAPPRLNRNILDIINRRKTNSSTVGTITTASTTPLQIPKKKNRIPNPLVSLYILREKDISIILFYNSLVFVAYYDIVASLPHLFQQIYNYDDLHIGLCYLPFGLGCSIAALINGKLLDYNYRRIARKNNFTIDKRSGDDLKDFPIEEARLGAIFPMLYLALAAIVCYGWALEKNSQLAGPLVLQFIMGLCLTATFNSLSTILVDMYPQSPATAAAGNNFVRCLMGAGATAIIEIMIQRMGRGWCFTFIGLVCTAFSPLLFVELKFGRGWREERRLRVERYKEEKERTKETSQG
ncbi:MAG: hypothetical protein LQ351_004580 [Letrouitia transgressa]|nr:MAG: hypothetical protein LQ351_004580 [Letrouitia transgressa]